MKDSQFSQREKEVIDLLIQGKSNKQIALTLHIAQSTVEYHLKNIYQKLDVHSRTEAVLRLGKSIGADSPGELRESIVETDRRDVDNDDKSLLLQRFPVKQKSVLIVGLLVLIFSLIAMSIFRFLATPKVSQADRMETAISTASTAFAALTETHRAIPTVPPQGSGLLGRYYIVRGQILPANPFMDRNLVLTRVDKTVDFIWPDGGQESPGKAMPNDLFAIRWDGQVYAPVTGVYTFGTYHDDGARLYVDNTLLYNDWKEGESRKAQNRIRLIAGTWYPIRLEFWENVWTAEVQLFWSFPGHVENIIPSVNLKPDVSTALAETQPALPTPSRSPSRAPSNTPWPTNTASPAPPSTEEATLSSTQAPETLTPGTLTCQLNINQNIHVLGGTNLWFQPDVVNGSLLGTLPAGTSVYVISAPAWGRIQETGVSGWWWEISNESNGAGTGWIWEGE